MGEIIPSESLSRVTYTGIKSMHSQKTKQPYIRNAKKRNKKNKKKNQTEKKKEKKKKKKNAVEDDEW